jgi:ceramide glucosyltransferase
MVGKLFAIRSDALSAVGGFDSLVGALGEDMLLARRLTEGGRRLVMGTAVAESRASGRSLHAVVSRYARWITVIRAQRPALLVSYPLLFASTPGLLALSTAALVTDGSVAWRAFAAVVMARAWVLLVARQLSRRPLRASTQAVRALFFAFASDFVLFAAFMRAMIWRQLTWRGISLTTRGAQLHEVGPLVGLDKWGKTRRIGAPAKEAES